MKSEKCLDPRVVNCPFRHFHHRYNKSICEQEIEGRFCLGVSCPYIADSEEFETATLSQIRRTLNEILSSHNIETDEKESIIEDVIQKLQS